MGPLDREVSGTRSGGVGHESAKAPGGRRRDAALGDDGTARSCLEGGAICGGGAPAEQKDTALVVVAGVGAYLDGGVGR